MKLNPNTYTKKEAIKSMINQGYTREAAETHPVLDTQFNERDRRIIDGVKPPADAQRAAKVGRTSLDIMDRAAFYATTRVPIQEDRTPEITLDVRGRVITDKELQSVLETRE